MRDSFSRSSRSDDFICSIYPTYRISYVFTVCIYNSKHKTSCSSSFITYRFSFSPYNVYGIFLKRNLPGEQITELICTYISAQHRWIRYVYILPIRIFPFSYYTGLDLIIQVKEVLLSQQVTRIAGYLVDLFLQVPVSYLCQILTAVLHLAEVIVQCTYFQACRRDLQFAKVMSDIISN